MWSDRESNPGPLTYESDAYRLRYAARLISVKQNRIEHRVAKQTEKSQPEGKRIMPESSFTDIPALSVDPRVWISRSASETNV